MIFKETFLSTVDNSGAVKMKCIHIHGGLKQKTPKVGGLVSVTCRKVKPKKKKRPFRKGDKAKAVVIALKKPFRDVTGALTGFYYNAVVPFQRKAQQEWLGPKLGCTRLKAPIGFSPYYERIHKETKKKLFSLANKVVW